MDKSLASESSRFRSHEDMSVWLSTTLISALRNMIDLWTYHFEVMQEYLDGLLDILVACICQGGSLLPNQSVPRPQRDGMADHLENDTLARIGTSCFQQLLESNVRKLSPAKWETIVSAFVQLFTTTTAYQLFDPQLHAEVEPDNMTDEPDGECSERIGPCLSPR